MVRLTRITRINYVTAGFMILMAITGVRGAYSNIRKYGWTYIETTTIGDEITETTVSVSTEIFASIFLAVLAGLFLINGRVAGMSFTLDIKPLDEDEVTGITFPKGDPEHWDLGVDLRTRVIDVTLNDFTMSFPLTKILGWVEEHEQKKMDEMK